MASVKSRCQWRLSGENEEEDGSSASSDSGMSLELFGLKERNAKG